ncbi:hypothetical protein TKK_0010582 [Trichogramma kaykai]|uniref:Uncharacterized protein n=1 Tax=Trichogramma kaykai TaxID=54128 RepID=A0ABD2WVB2_9HYME
MIKYWVKIRGLDVDHLTRDLDETRMILTYDQYLRNLCVLRTFYLEPLSMDFLRDARWALRRGLEERYADWIDSEYDEQFVTDVAVEVARLKSIEVKEGLSLYDLCQMDHRKGSMEMKDRWSDWRCPELHELDYTRLKVRREHKQRYPVGFVLGEGRE